MREFVDLIIFYSILTRHRERSLSFDDTKADEDDFSIYVRDEDEHLHPGSYLIPVRDPLFTVRLREYRRTRYDKMKQIETLIASRQHQRLPRQIEAAPRTNSVVTILTEPRPYTQRPVKERYHIDPHGRLIQRGSLSRSYSTTTLRASCSSSVSRQSASPMPGSISGIVTGTETLAQPFQHFLDHKLDKRSMLGEGSAPIVREKLKDLYLLVGSRVTFRCRIEGNPAPRSFWYHNDRLIIDNDDRFEKIFINITAFYRAVYRKISF